MANNGFIPELAPAPQPTILVRIGIFIASTVVLAVFSPPPHVGFLGTEFNLYVFYISLAMLFLFGIGLIVLGWFAADGPEDRYNVAMRIAIRAAQLMLVLAVGLYEVYTNS